MNVKAKNGGVLSKLTPQNVVKILRTWIRTDHSDMVMEKKLSDATYTPKSGLSVVEGDRQAVIQLCRENPDKMRGEEVKFLSYLDCGYRPLLAEIDGRIVGHIWWHDHRLDRTSLHPQVIRLGIDLAPGEVYSFDLFLLPQHRGGGASNDLFGLFRKHLRDAGYTKVYGVASASNLPAVWIHKLQGYRTVRTVESQLLCGGALLWSEGRLFLRNPTVVVKQKFDYRSVW
jgi:GNAT superfamily N-acetyltransferase